MTLVGRLALATGAVVVTLVLGSTALAVRWTAAERMEDRKTAAESVTSSWTAALERELPVTGAPSADLLARWPNDHLLASGAALYIASGDSLRLVSTSGPTAPVDATTDDRLALARGETTTARVRTPQEAWRVAEPVGARAATALLIATFPVDDLLRTAERERRIILGLALLAALAAAGASVALVRLWLVGPLDRFAQAIVLGTSAGEMASAPAVPVEGPTEVRRLAVRFNALRTALMARERENGARAALAVREERAAALERLALAEETAAGFAHDVGTPLNTMRGHLQLLRDDLLSAADAGADDRLRTVLGQLDRVTAAVQRRLRDGTWPEPQQAVHDLREVATRLLAFLAPTFDAAHVHAALSAAPNGRPIHARCDADLVEQIGLNLLKNAVEAMPDGGAIQVDVGRDATHAWLEIADSGPGVNADVRTHLFQPFITTKGEQGTGLGLAVSRRLARSLGGDLVLLDDRDGAAWRILLPLAEKA